MQSYILNLKIKINLYYLPLAHLANSDREYKGS
jgi:hypothetical protein